MEENNHNADSVDLLIHSAEIDSYIEYIILAFMKNKFTVPEKFEYLADELKSKIKEIK